jgi:hypothetical protein
MAQINWLKASLRGRLGEVVGSSWRGTEYVKVYTKPGNPNTEKQQEVRGLMAHLAHLGHDINAVLSVYSRPVPQKMTQYNAFIKRNSSMFGKQGHKWDPLQVVVFDGDLEPEHLEYATIVLPTPPDPNPPMVTMRWDATAGNPDDWVFLVVYDNESKKVVYRFDVFTRNECGPGTSIGIPLDSMANVSSFTEIYVYMALYTHDSDTVLGRNSRTTVRKALIGP